MVGLTSKLSDRPILRSRFSDVALALALSLLVVTTRNHETDAAELTVVLRCFVNIKLPQWRKKYLLQRPCPGFGPPHDTPNTSSTLTLSTKRSLCATTTTSTIHFSTYGQSRHHFHPFSAAMAILDILNKPMFASRFKLPLHITTGILVVIVIGLSVPRLFMKNQPRTRAGTIALGMVRTSLVCTGLRR